MVRFPGGEGDPLFTGEEGVPSGVARFTEGEGVLQEVALFTRGEGVRSEVPGEVPRIREGRGPTLLRPGVVLQLSIGVRWAYKSWAERRSMPELRRPIRRAC